MDSLVVMSDRPLPLMSDRPSSFTSGVQPNISEAASNPLTLDEAIARLSALTIARTASPAEKESMAQLQNVQRLVGVESGIVVPTFVHRDSSEESCSKLISNKVKSGIVVPPRVNRDPSEERCFKPISDIEGKVEKRKSEALNFAGRKWEKAPPEVLAKRKRIVVGRRPKRQENQSDKSGLRGKDVRPFIL